MRRRDFLEVIIGSTAAWPLAARAQQGERVRRIGVLTPLAADDPESMARIGAFLQGLGELGWAVGRNLRIDYRWSAGDPDRTRKDAMELVALAPDVILSTGTPVTAALQGASLSVPIVFAQVPDPVANGFVVSLARPGGNTTDRVSHCKDPLYEALYLGMPWTELDYMCAVNTSAPLVFRISAVLP